MNRKNIVIILLLSVLPISLASVLEVKEAFRREISDFRAEELRFRAGGFEIDTDTNREISYEGEIADPELREKLWDIITEQRKQPKIQGGNYLGGTPYLVLHTPNGADYTLSYTWDREEEGVDDYGEPVISHVGRAFVINGTRSEKYQATAEEEFGKLIMEYLRANAVPEDQAKDTGTAKVTSKEKLWQKSAETDSIVFVDCYQNLAWGYQC